MSSIIQNQQSKKIYIVTGANSGLGFDATRQLALRNDVQTVYMACRSKTKAQVAIQDLVTKHSCSKEKLRFLQFDASSSQQDIIKAVDASLLSEEVLVSGFIMNAGGMGNDTTGKPVQPNQTTSIMQMNLIGHIHLLEYLVQRGNISTGSRVIYAGSEASRGIAMMGIKSPYFTGTTPSYYTKLVDGTAYKSSYKTMDVYAQVKGIAVLYLAAWARQHPDIFVLTVSPGGTKGTNVATHEAMPWMMRKVFPTMARIMGWFGAMHPLEVGAKRYVDAVLMEGDFMNSKSGTFYASKRNAPSGPTCNQAVRFGKNGAQYADIRKQTAAFEAVNSFL